MYPAPNTAILRGMVPPRDVVLAEADTLHSVPRHGPENTFSPGSGDRSRRRSSPWAAVDGLSAGQAYAAPNTAFSAQQDPKAAPGQGELFPASALHAVFFVAACGPPATAA